MLASAADRNRSEMNNAHTPYVPILLSRMISSLRSRVLAPNESATYANPSSCRHPVTTTLATNTNPTASYCKSCGWKRRILCQASETIYHRGDQAHDVARDRQSPARAREIGASDRRSAGERKPRREKQHGHDIRCDLVQRNDRRRRVSLHEPSCSAPLHRQDGIARYNNSAHFSSGSPITTGERR